MNHLKTILMLAALLFLSVLCHAGNPFVPTTKGMTLKYAEYNEQGKLIGYSTQEVVSVTSSPKGTLIKIKNEELDANGKKLQTKQTGNDEQYDYVGMIDFTEILITAEKVSTKITIFDNLLDQVKDAGENISFEMTEITYPVKPHVGQALAPINASLSVKADKKNKSYNLMSLRITERKVSGFESCSVNAGTFKCWKTTENIELSSMFGINEKGTTITWFADGIGEVMTQDMNKRGKVMSTKKLISVTYK